LKASVLLDTNFHVGEIDRRIFGGFLEHLGRAVYEGVYDPGSPRADENGFRRDVLDALRHLGMPIMRYPGGNFVSCYDWTDGIGPRDKRPAKRDFAWRSIESNQFGTDEFMQWCEAAQTEPMMAVNLGTSGAKEAAALVEYCNLPAGTFWADRRAGNGHQGPYGVKLWCLGNEMDGAWQAGHVPADVYAHRAFAASVMMKGMDPSIKTVACGSSGRSMHTYLAYDRTVLDYCWDKVDFISAHRYSTNERNDSAWFLAEGVEIDRIIEDYSGLIDYVRGVKRSEHQVHLSFDEWNVWYREKGLDAGWGQAPHLLEEVYNFEDALVCAQYLNSFIRHADVVKVACIAQVVNVIAPILTRRDGLLVQSIYYPFALFSEAVQGVSLRTVLTSPLYRAGERGETPALDVSASFDARDGTAAVFVVNRQQEQAAVSIRFADRQITRIDRLNIMGGVHLKAANTWEKPGVVEPFIGKGTLVDGGAVVNVPGPGLAVVQLATSAR
jgi:alpha-N-arabinofuranosidase